MKLTNLSLPALQNHLYYCYGILLFCIFTFGCTSDELEPPDKFTPPYLDLYRQSPEKYMEVIKEFSELVKSKRENVPVSNSTFYFHSIENAAQLIESTCNLDFLSKRENLSAFKKETMSLNIQVGVDDYVIIDDLATAYNKLFQHVESLISRDDDNRFVLLDVASISRENGITEFVIDIVTAATENELKPCGVAEDDFWHPGNDMGKCDIPAQVPWDAADREMEIMNNSIYCPTDCIGTLFSPIILGVPFNYNDSPLGDLDWWVWHNGITTCLEPADMELNIAILKDIQDIIHPIQFAPDFVSSFIESEEYWWVDEYRTHHDGIMYYGFLDCTPIVVDDQN